MQNAVVEVCNKEGEEGCILRRLGNEHECIYGWSREGLFRELKETSGCSTVICRDHSRVDIICEGDPGHVAGVTDETRLLLV